MSDNVPFTLGEACEIALCREGQDCAYAMVACRRTLGILSLSTLSSVIDSCPDRQTIRLIAEYPPFVRSVIVTAALPRFRQNHPWAPSNLASRVPLAAGTARPFS